MRKRRGGVVIAPVLMGTPGEHASRTRTAAANASPPSMTPALRAAPRRRYKITWKPPVFSLPAALSRTASSAASTSARGPGGASAS